MVIWVPASHTKIKFTLQLQEQKSGRRVTQCSHILCGGCCTRPKESSPLQPFQIRYFVVRFDHKYGYLCAYHSSKIKFTLQLQEKKGKEGNTRFSYTIWRLLQLTKRKFSSGTIPNKIFWGAFWWKIWLFVCIPQAAKSSLLFNQRNKKVVGGMHNVLVH